MLLGTRSGSFQTPPYQTVGENPMAVASGDFNGDGRLNLVTASSVSSAAYVLLQKTTGHSPSPRTG